MGDCEEQFKQCENRIRLDSVRELTARVRTKRHNFRDLHDLSLLLDRKGASEEERTEGERYGRMALNFEARGIKKKRHSRSLSKKPRNKYITSRRPRRRKKNSHKKRRRARKTKRRVSFTN